MLSPVIADSFVISLSSWGNSLPLMSKCTKKGNARNPENAATPVNMLAKNAPTPIITVTRKINS
jgi:hypothetical protein